MAEDQEPAVRRRDPADVAIGQSMVVAYGAGAPGAIAGILGSVLD
ncbi:hypothetical protein [Streptomyces sp. NPDC001401]